MVSMICNIWDKFTYWVSVEWSQLTFIIVASVFAIIALTNILAFLKGNKYNKDKKPFKWGSLAMTILAFGILAILFAAKFT